MPMIDERRESEVAGIPSTDQTPEPGTGVAPHVGESVTFTGRFLVPLLVPFAVAATIIFYVLNVSRIFLAAESALALAFAIAVTLAILIGGAALSAAPKLRGSSITLVVSGGLLFVLVGGLISIGAASPKTASGPVQCAPVQRRLTIDAGAGGSIRFSFPQGSTIKAGCVDLKLQILGGSHTLQFDDAAAAGAFPELGIGTKSWTGVLKPGKYVFHCTIDSHAANGMVATLLVTS
jgi:Multicopper oxidase